ncbi:acyl-CoA dehydrogenase family protein [Egibacter rhizosphaerae]|uniref:acyl-CoA dehydrogenase family protein n=1 Tax=Egibacter rhizosphaerae TaxID=1670831 RepID=UPI0013F1609B|nr:acyl-CoA dehydrogenase family protein [Egibacter rhizosphaerae]
MDFTIPSELDALRASFATFLDREVRPLEDQLAEALRREPVGPDVQAAANSVRRRSCEAGFYAAHMPEQVGGWDLSALGMTLLVEDAARSGLALAGYALGPPNPHAPTPLLLELPEHLRDRYVAPLMRGEATMCFALTEPEAGSDAQAITTRARREGDEWVLDGMKHYITNGEDADLAIVFAVTDPDKRAQGGITALLVPREAYAVGATQLTMADSHPVELFFDGSRVPSDHVVGEVGQGFYAAMRFLNAGRAYIGAQCLGMAEWCVDQAAAHARTREAFGQPLASFQGVTFPLAESKAEIEAMRWLTYHLAWSCDEVAAERDPGDGVPLDSSVVKWFNTEYAHRIADRCLQVFGGQGLLRDGPIERVLRHLRMLRVVEGASEVQLMVIARALTGGR